MRKVNTIREDDIDVLMEGAAQAFFDTVKKLSEYEDYIVVSLCGGNSIRPFFEKLVEKSDSLTSDEWRRIHFFWTDERIVPPTHEDSNYRMAHELLLLHLGSKELLLEENVHRFKAESGDLDDELENYSDELDMISGGVIHIPLLGVGPDGHIASLFPQHELLDTEEHEFLLIEDSPKPPEERMTISPSHVVNADFPFLFFIGEGKKKAYDRFRNDDIDDLECPAKLALEGEEDEEVFVVTDLT